MKKNKISFIAVLCTALMAAFIIGGCKQASGKTGLEGSWMVDPEEYEGDPDEKLVVIFNEDGNAFWDYHIGEDKLTQTGKWSAKGDILTIVYFYDDEDMPELEESAKFKIEGDVLTMTYPDGDFVELNKVK